MMVHEPRGLSALRDLRRPGGRARCAERPPAQPSEECKTASGKSCCTVVSYPSNGYQTMLRPLE